MSYRNRVSRCPHGFALGVPLVHCEVFGCVASRRHRTREDGKILCRACRGYKLLGDFSVNGDGSLRSECKRCHRARLNRRAVTA